MSRARPVSLLFALLMTLAFRASAQPTAQSAPAPPKATIIGQVVDGASGQAIPSAIVTLDRSTHVMTTSDGRFAFRNLDPGSYGLSATKSGYISAGFGAQRAGGAPRSVVIVEGQRRRDVVIRLWRHAAITGTVIDEAGEPVIGVSVTALRRTTVGGRVKFVPEGYSTPTDDRGMYRISHLGPGAYVVLVRAHHLTVPAALLEHAKDGFIQALFGRNPGGAMRLTQSLMEIGGLGGFEGDFHSRQISGHVQMMSAEMPTPPPAGLSPLLMYPTVYYPNAASIRATSLVTVTSGQERSAVNLQLTPVPMARVSGTLSAPTGSAAYIPIKLTRDSQNADRDAITTMTDDNGRFTFLAVPSGDYTLLALDTPPPVTFFGQFTIVDTKGAEVSGIAGSESPAKPDATPSTLWASTPLSVGETDVADLAISLRQGFTISGQVEFEGTDRPTAEQLAETSVYIAPANGDMGTFQMAPAKLDKSDRFTTMALPPGRYLLNVMCPADRWSLQSVVAADRDISGVAIEIESRNLSNVVLKMTDRPASLSGSVQASENATQQGAFVVVFPTDPETWITMDEVSSGRIRKASVADNGHYEFRALFPGDYYVAAIRDSAVDDWQDPAVLKQLIADAVHVQIGEGEKVSRDIRLQELR
jgi:Carboxypeptidase regulatory-like domain